MKRQKAKKGKQIKDKKGKKQTYDKKTKDLTKSLIL